MNYTQKLDRDPGLPTMPSYGLQFPVQCTLSFLKVTVGSWISKPPLRAEFLLLNSGNRDTLTNTIKSLSLSCRHLFFLSILKTIRSERAKSFSLRQGIRFIIDANEGNAPVRQITNGKIQKHYCLPGLKSCDFSFRRL